MKRLLPILMVAFLLAGCTSYYKIVDATTSRAYYTKSISSKKSGAVTFKDANTGAKVTLLEHEQHKITKEEYENSVNPQGKGKADW